jgi:hypothetical protein
MPGVDALLQSDLLHQHGDLRGLIVSPLQFGVDGRLHGYLETGFETISLQLNDPTDRAA